MMHARLKTPVVQVWQYADKRLVNLPSWINACTERHSDGLYLIRLSGKQRIDLTDWLVREPGGETLWLPDAEFQREYELLWVTRPPVA
jgi:hypothetical protein